MTFNIHNWWSNLNDQDEIIIGSQVVLKSNCELFEESKSLFILKVKNSFVRFYLDSVEKTIGEMQTLNEIAKLINFNVIRYELVNLNLLYEGCCHTIIGLQPEDNQASSDQTLTVIYGINSEWFTGDVEKLPDLQQYFNDHEQLFQALITLVRDLMLAYTFRMLLPIDLEGREVLSEPGGLGIEFAENTLQLRYVVSSVTSGLTKEFIPPRVPRLEFLSGDSKRGYCRLAHLANWLVERVSELLQKSTGSELDLHAFLSMRDKVEAWLKSDEGPLGPALDHAKKRAIDHYERYLKAFAKAPEKDREKFACHLSSVASTDCSSLFKAFLDALPHACLTERVILEAEGVALTHQNDNKEILHYLYKKERARYEAIFSKEYAKWLTERHNRKCWCGFFGKRAVPDRDLSLPEIISLGQSSNCKVKQYKELMQRLGWLNGDQLNPFLERLIKPPHITLSEQRAP